MNSFNHHVACFLNSKPNNKLVFTKSNDWSIDIGMELSKKMKEFTRHKRLSMKAKDVLDELMNGSVKKDERLGRYIAIKNLCLSVECNIKILKTIK